MTISKLALKVEFKLYTIYCKINAFRYRLHPRIHLGKNVLIERGATLSCLNGGKIIICDGSVICKGAQLLTHGGDILIGSNSSINPYTIVYGQGGTRIGNDVRIAAHCVIVPSNHVFIDRNTLIRNQGLSKKGIIIEDDCWLGAGVKVLDGVVVRKGSVIGANSVVTHETTEFGVYVGVPATKIKNRS